MRSCDRSRIGLGSISGHQSEYRERPAFQSIPISDLELMLVMKLGHLGMPLALTYLPLGSRFDNPMRGSDYLTRGSIDLPTPAQRDFLNFGMKELSTAHEVEALDGSRGCFQLETRQEGGSTGARRKDPGGVMSQIWGFITPTPIMTVKRKKEKKKKKQDSCFS